MRLIAHRGYSGIAPENTLAAFQKAIDAGCTTIEFDVQLSRDAVPFVIHDPTLDRTTTGHGKVIETTARDLSHCGAGYFARFGDTFEEEHLPTLEETLAFLKGKAQVFIEIKSESVFQNREDVERSVVDLLDRFTMIGDAIIISFEPLALLRTKRFQPKLKTGYLVARDDLGRGLDKTAEIGAEMILYHRSQVDRMKIDMAHSRGFQCAIYTVDTPEELLPYLDMGLDGIGSNFPGELIQYLKKHQPEKR